MSASCHQRRSGALFDHIISLSEQRGRHGEAERIRGLAIDDEFELRRLLDREISRFGALKNLVHVRSGAPEEVGETRAVGHQTPIVREFAKAIHGREAAAGSQGHNPGPIRNSEGVIQGDEGLSVAPRSRSKRCFEVLAHREGEAPPPTAERPPRCLAKRWHGRRPADS